MFKRVKVFLFLIITSFAFSNNLQKTDLLEKTIRIDNGFIYDIQVTNVQTIQIVPDWYFDNLNYTMQPISHGNGEYYSFIKCKTGNSSVIYIKNQSNHSLREINRDSAWKRRKELASRLLPQIDNGNTISCETKCQLILSVLTSAYKVALGVNVPNEEIVEVFFRNSQTEFDNLIRLYSLGVKQYDAKEYAQNGPLGANYSHLSHFAWIYWKQIERLQSLLREFPASEITVVDIGTGGANFILSAAKIMTENERKRIRFVGIDKGHKDLCIALKMIDECRGLNIQLLFDDVTTPGFPKRLKNIGADLIIANHLLEHLPGNITDYINDWLDASKSVLSVSVPLGDDLDDTISDHEHSLDVQYIQDIYKTIAHDGSSNIQAINSKQNKYLGLLEFKKAPRFDQPTKVDNHLTLKPQSSSKCH